MTGIDAALLQSLRDASVYLTGTELAAQVSSTLSAVESRIAELRIAGFEIDERPGLGYRFFSAPDRLIADDLWSRLGHGSLVREILVFQETDSTNDQAARIAREGAAGGLVVFAERQKAGRGRFGRRWESASHLGLWGSILLRPGFPILHWPRLTTCAAVAIAIAIEQTLKLKAEIKWPNDIHIGGKKVAGILMETGIDRMQQPFAVLGMGINANHTLADFPPELAEKASSLREASGSPVDRAGLVVAILRELELRIDSAQTFFELTVGEATQRSSLLNRWIEVRVADASIQGLAEELDSEGHLVLREASGRRHRLTAGEVTVLGWS